MRKFYIICINILITLGSMLIFWSAMILINVIYLIILGEASLSQILEVIAGATLITIVVFISFLYFPIQVSVLTIDRLLRVFLFFIPLILTAIIIIVAIYYLVFISAESRFIHDSLLFIYLRLGCGGFVFVILNNLFISAIRARLAERAR